MDQETPEQWAKRVFAQDQRASKRCSKTAHAEIDLRYEPEKSRLYVQQNGYCFWCWEPMLFFWLPTDGANQPENLATIDHFYSRFHPKRYSPEGLKKVLACYLCNAKRSWKEQALLNNGALKPANKNIYSGPVDYKPVLHSRYGPKLNLSDKWLIDE